MAAPQIDAPPVAPVRGEAREDFQTKSNLFIGWFSTLVTQLTAALSWVNTKADEVEVNAQAVAAVANVVATLPEGAIDDTTPSGITTYSSNKIDSAIAEASPDADLIIHTIGSGLANEGQTKAQSDAAYLPIGGNAASASQATKLATARTINGVLFNGTAGININIANSAAQVGAATAGIATGAVGSYILAAPSVLNTVSYAPGSTIAGSGLYPCDVSNLSSGTTLAGTWRCMGVSNYNSGSSPTRNGTSWLRIS